MSESTVAVAAAADVVFSLLLPAVANSPQAPASCPGYSHHSKPCRLGDARYSVSLVANTRSTNKSQPPERGHIIQHPLSINEQWTARAVCMIYYS